MKLTGVFLPIPTTFAEGVLDETALRSNIERWVTTGISGLVVLGTNGEAPLLDDQESDKTIETARGVLPTGLTLMAGTGRESTQAAIAAARRAARVGADAVLVRTPSYFRTQMTDAALVRHFTAVADASPVPVLLYNFTAMTGVTLSVSAVAKLSEHPNIAGMKESGSDVARVGELVQGSSPEFAVLAGSAPTIFASLCAGAAGGILALACVVPEIVVRLYALTVEQRFSEAAGLQRRLVPLARLVTSTHGIPGLKAALDVAGYIGGQPRPPLLPVAPEAVEEIRSELEILRETVMKASAV